MKLKKGFVLHSVGGEHVVVAVGERTAEFCGMIRRDGTVCYMRGDNTYELEPVPADRVIGAVTHIYRKGKMFSVTESVRYRLYIYFWCAGYPLRWLIWRLRVLIGQILHMFKKG